MLLVFQRSTQPLGLCTYPSSRCLCASIMFFCYILLAGTLLSRSPFRMARTCCGCLLSIILSVGTFLLFFFLFQRPKRPNCSIQLFYVPTLDKSANYTVNNTIIFILKLDNTNVLKGIYYDPLNLTLSYGPNAIANYTAPGFYQGYHKKTRRGRVVETHGVPWGTLLNGSAPPVFRVDLVTAVRIKNIVWKTNRRKMVVGAAVEVNDHGRNANEKGIQMITSRATRLGCDLTVPLVVSSSLLVLSLII